MPGCWLHGPWVGGQGAGPEGVDGGHGEGRTYCCCWMKWHLMWVQHYGVVGDRVQNRCLQRVGAGAQPQGMWPRLQALGVGR
jgi:hypothetical protein